MSAPENACSCPACVKACIYKPGWFAPGEAEKAAALLGLDLPTFFAKYLGVDYWQADPPVFLLAPAITSMDPGEVYPFEPTGRCRLLVDDRCLIHEAKPAECAAYDHNRTGNECHATKKSIVDKWRSQQEQVRQLLGDDPVEPEGSNVDLLLWR